MKLITIPFLGANDDSCVVIDLFLKNGEPVKKGQLLFVIETTKSAIDIEADEDGFFFSNLKVGEKKIYGESVAVIASSVNDETAAMTKLNESSSEDKSGGGRLTKKAEILLQKYNIPLKELQDYAKGSDINEALVTEFMSIRNNTENRIGIGNLSERIAILGGVGGGGALIVIDAILRCPLQTAVCIYEGNPANHGKNVLGVPVLGSMDQIMDDFAAKKFDSVIIAFNRNLDDRKEVFGKIKEMGIPFANVIDPTVEIRAGVKMGVGNVILAKTYIAACTEIGDNNFISSNVCLEHGNLLGSHNAFGPGVFTSGNVIMKERIRFGTGVFIEPGVTIGNNVNLGSFVLINHNIDDNSILKRKQDYVIKSK